VQLRIDRSSWPVHRLGIIMRPDPTDPREAAGVLNPGAVRGPDGQLYILPRLVAAGNYSRIGLARVMFNHRGDPIGVERLGVVLEPQAPYELNPRTGGGVEDARVTHLAARGLYVMTYTAYGPAGPRIAAAVSHDLRRWRRTGLVRFAPLHGRDLGVVANKDGLLFPEPVTAPDGRLALALIHRPTFRVSAHNTEHALPPDLCGCPSMWISYAPWDEIAARKHVLFGQHHRLAEPERGWERLKVGGGTPPVRSGEAWLVLYHGVRGCIVEGVDQQQAVRYSVGALLLDGRDPRQVLYRSVRPILAPRSAAERVGVVPRVTGGLPDRPGRTVRRHVGYLLRHGRQPHRCGARPPRRSASTHASAGCLGLRTVMTSRPSRDASTAVRWQHEPPDLPRALPARHAQPALRPTVAGPSRL
jgi:beta-1,2-mannobiose phosphorylase / 1,2-beta-oligomannan phosphorylase